MSVYDFLSLLIEDDAKIAIYDMTLEIEVFADEAREVLDCDFCDWEVLSFDLCNDDPRGVVMVLNVESDDD